MTPHGHRLRALAVVVTVTISSLGIRELVLRRLDVRVGLVRVGWTGRSSPLAFGRGAERWIFNQMDSRGVPIEYDDEDLVVVLVGDSQVEAAALENEGMPEVALRRSLASLTGRSIRVFSVAASGWGQDQGLLELGRYFERYRADIVINWLTPGNDLWENAFAQRTNDADPGPLKPTFALDGKDLVAPDERPGELVDRVALLQLLRRSILGGTDRTALRGAGSLVPQPKTVRDAGCGGLERIKWTDYFGNDVADELEVEPDGRYLVTTVEAVADGRTHFGSRLAVLQSVDEYERDLMAALLQRMKQVAETHGSRFATFYAVSPVQEESAARVECVAGPDGSVRRLDPSEDAVLERVTAPGSLVRVRLPGYLENHVSRGDRHRSALGYQRAMGALARELVARGIVPRG
ncbi:MAG: hypothetical protein ACKOCV_06350 [Gemmatimonadota bacterium]